MKYSAKLSKLRHKAKLLKRTLDEMRSSLVLVEGKHDKKALKAIDVHNTLSINANPNVAFNLPNKDEVIVLTDFDESGEELCSRLSGLLLGNNIMPNTEVRRRLRYILGLKHIEEIDVKLREFEELIERMVI